MKNLSKIAFLGLLLVVACSDTGNDVSDLQVEAARSCLALEKSRRDLSNRVSGKIASNSVTEDDILSLVEIFRHDIDKKNRCLKRYTRSILKTDELSAEFSQYLSDVSSARSLLTVLLERWSESDGNRVSEVLALALEYMEMDEA